MVSELSSDTISDTISDTGNAFSADELKGSRRDVTAADIARSLMTGRFDADGTTGESTDPVGERKVLLA